jgi:hypothetical protein
MDRTASLDVNTLSRDKKKYQEVVDSEVETESDYRSSVNLDVVQRPTFVTISRMKKPRVENEPSADQILEQLRQQAKQSNDPKIQFEFAKACLAAGDSNVEEGFTLLKKISSGGYPEANFFLGDAFADDGKDSMAYSQYLMAAKRGFAPACHAIATCAEKGKGCKRNIRLSLEMYTKAATAGNLNSMHRLGLAELNGELGLRPDVQKAVKWFKRASAGILFLKKFLIEIIPNHYTNWPKYTRPEFRLI